MLFEDNDKMDVNQIKIGQDLLQDQHILARRNRSMLDLFNVKMIDIMGSVGTGKTSIIQQLVKVFKKKYQSVVINGDLATRIDQERVQACGVDAYQINTGKECHLSASMIKGVLKQIDLQQADLILVENVGNLICPVDFPLGAHRRLMVISVTEGPYIVRKHPTVFLEMEYVAINKTDLSSIMDVNVGELVRDIKAIRDNVRIFPVSCRDHTGLADLAASLLEGL